MRGAGDLPLKYLRNPKIIFLKVKLQICNVQTYLSLLLTSHCGRSPIPYVLRLTFYVPRATGTPPTPLSTVYRLRGRSPPLPGRTLRNIRWYRNGSPPNLIC